MSKKIGDSIWQECDDLFYLNLDSIVDKYGFITIVGGYISWDLRNRINYVIMYKKQLEELKNLR